MPISIIDNLGTILSGLKTSQQLLNTATRNISNAQTPNYVVARQHSVVSKIGAGGSSAGEVQRIVDESLLQQQRQTTADVNYNQARKDGLAKISALAGDPSQETNLGALVQALGNAFQALAGNPTSPGLTDDVVNKAQALVNELNNQNSALLTLQKNSLQTMQDQMSKVNLDLNTIADLNAKVNTAIAPWFRSLDLEGSARCGSGRSFDQARYSGFSMIPTVLPMSIVPIISRWSPNMPRS